MFEATFRAGAQSVKVLESGQEAAKIRLFKKDGVAAADGSAAAAEGGRGGGGRRSDLGIFFTAFIVCLNVCSKEVPLNISQIIYIFFIIFKFNLLQNAVRKPL